MLPMISYHAVMYYNTTTIGIYNSTSFGSHVLQRERKRFNQLFRRKAMVHHYTEYMEVPTYVCVYIALIMCYSSMVL